MATRTDVTLQPSNSTDALFRAWSKYIFDLMVTTGGWVQTGDTGQINFATVTAPAAVNTKQGYIVVRMADSLQATSPVFIRIDFGSGQSASASPGIWITIGTGSDGAGNITTKRFDGGAVAAATVSANTNSATASNSYGSADTNRVACGMFVQTTTVRCLTFIIERSKDSAGADTGDGLLFYYNNQAANVNIQRYVALTAAPQPVAEDGLQIILSNNNPSSFSGEVGIALPIPMKGYAQQPGYGMAVVKTSDFSAESTFTVSIYGNSITFQHLNIQTCNIPTTGGSSWGNSRVCIRFD